MTGKMRRIRAILICGFFGLVVALTGGIGRWAIPSGPNPPPQGATSTATASPQVATASLPLGNGHPTATNVLSLAIAAIESRETVSAKMRYEARLFGQRLLGSGSYVEQRPGRDHLFRLELRFQLGDSPSSLVNVCDGRYLWEYRSTGGKSELSRVDIVRAWRALERAGEPLAAHHAMALPGLGGVPRLLHGLNRQFEFGPAQRGKWSNPPVIVWRVEGQWRRESLKLMLPDQVQAIAEGRADLKRLPPQVPDKVICYLGEADCFPYRIEFRRQSSLAADPVTDQCILAVDFYDVRFNEPIDPSLMRYQPPSDTEFSDQTESFIQRLKAGPN
mgnify:CR=1 FL=1